MEKINDVTGIISASFIIGNVPFFVTDSLSLFQPASSIFVKIRIFSVFVYFYGSMFHAALTARKVFDYNKLL